MWRKPDEKHRPGRVGQYSDHSPRAGISVMLLGCITINGVGSLTEVEGNIDSAVYIHVLDDNLWLVISKNFEEKTWILQEDNRPVHRSKQPNTWKERNNINSLPWQSQSPDINIIENLWRKIKCSLEKRLDEITNRADLICVVKDILSNIDSTYVLFLYESIPKCIRAVVKCKGSITKY